MGREVKRVPVDFDWPINKTWGGYINPYESQSIKCPDCGGSCYSKVAQLLKDQWFGNAAFKPQYRGSVPFEPDHPIIWELATRYCKAREEHNGEKYSVSEQALRQCQHFNEAWRYHLNQYDVDALMEAGRLPAELTDGGRVPTPRELSEWHMASGRLPASVCVEAECKRLGVPVYCPRCNGDGVLWPSKEIREASEKWEPTEPPKGIGYQLWQDTGIGSPVSPVFEKPEDLAEWMAASKEYSQGKREERFTKEDLLKFILESEAL